MKASGFHQIWPSYLTFEILKIPIIGSKIKVVADLHTSYLSPRSPICRWRKNWSCGEISDFNTQQMWRNQKFCQIWRNFKILHMTDVKKSEIYPVFGCEICFVAIYAIFCLNCFVAIYALLCGKKLSRKLYRWRKNDKYEVCIETPCEALPTRLSQLQTSIII